MSRPDGFPIADHDVGFLDDDRILDAVRAGGYAVVVAYLAVRDASWARGERVTFARAIDRLPRAYGPDVEEALEALVAAGLLDADGRIPLASWEAWYAPAEERRATRRESGRRGGLAKAANLRSSDASSDASSVPLPVRPTDDLPHGRSVGRSPDARVEEPRRATSDDPAPSGPFSLPPKRPNGSAEVDCKDYVAHRFDHYRRRDGGFGCGACEGVASFP